jgi:[ribosomal protein S18]-alanine N-acetyltransferase
MVDDESDAPVDAEAGAQVAGFPRPGNDPAGGESVQLVVMRRRHLRSVLRIEGQVYPKPWSLTLYLSELNLRSTRHYIVARVGGTVVGYAGLLFADDEAHITTIAVDPAWHRHHIGTRLLLHQAIVARRRGAKHLTLEVRITNTPAQELYRRFGFAPEGIRKNYYAEINEDAVVMWARDIDTDEYEARLEGLAAGLPTPTRDDALEP